MGHHHLPAHREIFPLGLNTSALRILKLILLSAVLLFATVTLISLTIPSHIRISKAINLHRAAPALQLIADTGSWKYWHPVFINRPEPTDVQFQAVTDTLITLQTAQSGRAPLNNGFVVHSYASPDSVTLQWYIDFRLKWYPWQKFSSLFFENTYGEMMQEGLNNLKMRTGE